MDEHEDIPFSVQAADTFIRQLQQGSAPWQQPWADQELPVNPVSGNRYSGINALVLAGQGRPDPRWLTLRQAQQLGGVLREGERGTRITYWQTSEWRPKRNWRGKPITDAQGKPQMVRVQLERPQQRFVTVWNAAQFEALPSHERHPRPWDRVVEAERLVTDLAPKIAHEGQRADYDRDKDTIVVPARDSFATGDEYYAEVLRGLVRWSGHPDRLGRDQQDPPGSKGYARESLRVELAAMLLGKEMALDSTPSPDLHAKQWVSLLQEDPRELMRAAADAERAVRHLHGLQQQRQQANDQAAAQTPKQKDRAPNRSLVDGLVAARRMARRAGRAMSGAKARTDGRVAGDEPRREVPSGTRAPEPERALGTTGREPGPADTSREHEASPTNSVEALFELAADCVGSGELLRIQAHWDANYPGLDPVDIYNRRNALQDTTIGDLYAQAGLAVSPKVAVPDDPADTLTELAVRLAEGEERLYARGLWDEDFPGLDPEVVHARAEELRQYSPEHLQAAFLRVAGESVSPSPRRAEGAKPPPLPQRPVASSVAGEYVTGTGSTYLMAQAGDGDQVPVKFLGADVPGIGADKVGREAAAFAGWMDRVIAHPELVDQVAAFVGEAPEQPLSVPRELAAQAAAFAGLDDEGGGRSSAPQANQQAEPLTQAYPWLPEAPAPELVEKLKRERSGESRGEGLSNVEAQQPAQSQPAKPQVASRVAATSESEREAMAGEQKPYPSYGRPKLAVPFEERERAGKLGARWDDVAGVWYVKEGVTPEVLSEWAPENVEVVADRSLDPRAEFAEVLQSHGFILGDEDPIIDGHPHRVPVEGDGRGSKGGFYVAFPDGRVAGYFKNHRTGVEDRWKAKGYNLDKRTRDRMKAAAKAKQLEHKERTLSKQAEAAQRIAARLRVLPVPDKPTPYMVSKGVGLSAGVHVDDKGNTYVPLRDAAGKVWSAQVIRPDGMKQFARGGRIEGCFHEVGGPVQSAKAIVIAEGYSTAATLSELLGQPVVAAFNAGNLAPVAQALADKYPDKPIIFAADDDQHLVNHPKVRMNVGLEKAQIAAQAVGGVVMKPIFETGEQAARPGQLSDFNDLATKSSLGREAARQQVNRMFQVALQDEARGRSGSSGRGPVHGAELGR